MHTDVSIRCFMKCDEKGLLRQPYKFKTYMECVKKKAV